VDPNYEYEYLEHRAAGPWVALRFIKNLNKQQRSNLQDILAPRMRVLGVDQTDAISELAKVVELPMSEWGKASNEHVVRAVNEFIIRPYGPFNDLCEQAAD